MANELKTIEEIRSAIKRGYGYEQLKSKLEISDEEIIKLGSKHPDFMNEINKRYKLGFIVEEKPSEIKEIKQKSTKKADSTVEGK